MTGEELPPDTTLQHADVLRALLAGLSALEQTAARAQRRAQLPGNVGRAWTVEEETTLIAAVKAGDSLPDIATRHGRTLRAIEARLERLGLITPEQRTTNTSFVREGIDEGDDGDCESEQWEQSPHKTRGEDASRPEPP
jgi:hypothetical protein